MGSRLLNKIAVLTGSTGGIGQVIARRYLEEQAILVLTGRNADKLAALKNELVRDFPNCEQTLHTVIMDNAHPESVQRGALQIHKLVGKIDILINNAGSAGPKQRIGNIPISKEDLEQELETLPDAIGSILGGPWMLTCALQPYFNSNASIINVSTIFSKTEYFGRAAYVVPKAALNQLSKQLAIEFGLDKRCIRVNTIFPGPVESERIHSVFATMDKLQNISLGTTRASITSKMILQKENAFVSQENIANTAVFLGSNESGGFSGHEFEVTHGMLNPKNSELELIENPNNRMIDLENKWIWIIGSIATDDAYQMAVDFEKAGAHVLLTFTDVNAIATIKKNLIDNASIHVEHLHSYETESCQKIEKFFLKNNAQLDSVVVLPASDLSKYEQSVLKFSLQQIQKFLLTDFSLPIVVAKSLDAVFRAYSPRIIYVSNKYVENLCLAKIVSSSVQALIRIWRAERIEIKDARNGVSPIHGIHQIIRFENNSVENLSIVSKWAAWLCNETHSPRAIDLVISQDCQCDHQSSFQNDVDLQMLSGMHLHKVALVTGGSEGIGRQIARYLALSGARVSIASRDENKLINLQNELVAELRAADFSEPEDRILIIPDADIGDPKVPSSIVAKTIAKFGRVDFLVNNAGIVGEEQMVIDMSLDGWMRTLKANLISNYELIQLLLPQMRERKIGHIINMSSHFGGLRHATVVYPNRADYALSKSGQRMLAEDLAEFLGPDVQINAVAPGPVEGARISGIDDKPGLYQRRAKLILENKRLNLVYDFIINDVFDKNIVDDRLYALANNAIPTELSDKILIDESEGTSTEYLLNTKLLNKLINRLQKGMYLSANFSIEKLMQSFQIPPDEIEHPFYSKHIINEHADKIRNKMMHALALQRMPSEADVAREVVLYLANTNVTGETLYPSCGLSLDRFVTATQWLPSVSVNKDASLTGKIIMIIGGALFEEMATSAYNFLISGAQKVIILASFREDTKTLKHFISNKFNFDNKYLLANLVFSSLEDSSGESDIKKLTSHINDLIVQYGKPAILVNFPMSDISKKIFEDLPSLEVIEELMLENITNNFIVAQRACSLDNCCMIAVTQRGVHHAHRLITAFDSFFKGILRTFIATVGKEGSILSHKPRIYQIEPNGDANKVASAILDLAASSNNEYTAGMIFTV